MPLFVSITKPEFPSDYEFDIRGLGLLVNGTAREVNEDQEQAFYAAQGKTLTQAAEEDSSLSVSGTPTFQAPVEVVEAPPTTFQAPEPVVEVPPNDEVEEGGN